MYPIVCVYVNADFQYTESSNDIKSEYDCTQTSNCAIFDSEICVFDADGRLWLRGECICLPCRISDIGIMIFAEDRI